MTSSCTLSLDHSFRKRRTSRLNCDRSSFVGFFPVLTSWITSFRTGSFSCSSLHFTSSDIVGNPVVFSILISVYGETLCCEVTLVQQSIDWWTMNFNGTSWKSVCITIELPGLVVDNKVVTAEVCHPYVPHSIQLGSGLYIRERVVICGDHEAGSTIKIMVKLLGHCPVESQKLQFVSTVVFLCLSQCPTAICDNPDVPWFLFLAQHCSKPLLTGIRSQQERLAEIRVTENWRSCQMLDEGLECLVLVLTPLPTVSPEASSSFPVDCHPQLLIRLKATVAAQAQRCVAVCKQTGSDHPAHKGSRSHWAS